MNINKGIDKTDIISIIGMTGAGKTTVGKELAEILKRGFFDADAAVTEREGKTPREIFDIYGEDRFRKIETDVLTEMIARINESNEKAVISCGGGIVTREVNRELLKKHTYTVWLVRPLEDVIKDEEVIKRPPINGNVSRYEKIYEERQSLYMSVHDLRVDCANMDIESICKVITECLSYFSFSVKEV